MSVAVPGGLRAGKGDGQVLVAGWWQQTDRPAHHVLFLREKQVLFFPCARVCPCDYEMSAKSHYMLLSQARLGFLHGNLHSCKSDCYS